MRTLMTFVFLVAVGLGLLARSSQIRRDAVAAIERGGGGVMYNWQFKNGIPNADGKPWAPQWLVDCFGVDYFGDALDVVSQTRTTVDAQLIPVGRLRRLERLDLFDSAVTDAGLVHLEALSQLRTLDLTGADIGDAGLAHLKGLTKLRELDLNLNCLISLPSK
jgi:Leucine Rich repeat